MTHAKVRCSTRTQPASVRKILLRNWRKATKPTPPKLKRLRKPFRTLIQNCQRRCAGKCVKGAVVEVNLEPVVGSKANKTPSLRRCPNRYRQPILSDRYRGRDKGCRERS